MIPQRLGQVWLYHGGTPLQALLQPHGFRERVPPLGNLQQDELIASEPEEGPESSDVQL